MTHRPIASFVLPVVAVCAFLTMPLQAGSIAAGKPEELGFSSERLSRIHDAVQRHIEAKAIAGAVTLVVRNGRIAHHEAHGLIDLETNRPMPKDAIFRLASMSKPVTAVAVMMMLEEGKLRLTDPVSRFIPEFKGMKVAVPKPGSERRRSWWSRQPLRAAEDEAVHPLKSTWFPRRARSPFAIC